MSSHVKETAKHVFCVIVFSRGNTGDTNSKVSQLEVNRPSGGLTWAGWIPAVHQSVTAVIKAAAAQQR